MVDRRKGEANRRENEVDLIDLIGVLWKRKKFIGACVLICTVLAAAVSLAIPKVYRIAMVLQPGILKVREDGENIFIDSLKNIKAVVETNTFESRILAQVPPPAGEDAPPDIHFTVSTPRDSNALKVVYVTDDAEFGLTVMNKLAVLLLAKYNPLITIYQKDYDNEIRLNAGKISNLELVKSELENTIEAEKAGKEAALKDATNKIARIEFEISSLESGRNSEVERRTNQISTQEARIKAGIQQTENLKKRIADVDLEIGRINRNTDLLIKERDAFLANRENDADAISILVYSNTVQQNIVYLNTMFGQRADIRNAVYREAVDIERYKGDIRNLEAEIENRNIQTENKIEIQKTLANDWMTKKENLEKQTGYAIAKLRSEIRDKEKQAALLKENADILEFKKNSIQNIQILQRPMKSQRPVRPKKKLIVFVVFGASFTLAVFLSLFFEYLDTHRAEFGRNADRESFHR